MPDRLGTASRRAALLASLLCASLFAGLAGAATKSGTPPAPAGHRTEGLPTYPMAGEELELERGRATWYGRGFQGRRTASGERFNMNALTAAHKTLPFGTRLRVRNLHNSQEVVVRINDRGPFRADMVIDLSRAAAEALGLVGHGVKEVALTVIDPSPPPGTPATDEPAQMQQR